MINGWFFVLMLVGGWNNPEFAVQLGGFETEEQCVEIRTETLKLAKSNKSGATKCFYLDTGEMGWATITSAAELMPNFIIGEPMP
jgi:hypothetical protein